MAKKSRKPRLSEAQLVRPDPRQPFSVASPSQARTTLPDLREEYQYVVRDLRTIAIIAVVMLVLMIVLAIVLV